MINLQYPPEYEIKSTGDKEIRHLSKNGDLYAMDDIKVYKSSDWGETWVEVWEPTSNIVSGSRGQVKKLSTGELIVTANDRLFKSDENEENFEEKLQVENGFISRYFGIDVYENIVLVNEYNGDDDPVNTYLSLDYAENFHVIHTIPEPRTQHPHDVKYDPYEDLIWVAGSGNFPNDTVFFTANYGQKWYNMKEEREIIRITKFMPLPNCVLFGGDEYFEQNVYRQNRRKLGTGEVDLEPEKAFVPKKYYPTKGIMSWIQQSAISYAPKPYAIFGYRQLRSNPFSAATVWGTTDGYNFKALWSPGGIPESEEGDEGGIGIIGCFGPDENDNVAIHFAGRTPLTNKEHYHHVVKLSLNID